MTTPEDTPTPPADLNVGLAKLLLRFDSLELRQDSEGGFEARGVTPAWEFTARAPSPLEALEALVDDHG